MVLVHGSGYVLPYGHILHYFVMQWTDPNRGQGFQGPLGQTTESFKNRMGEGTMAPIQACTRIGDTHVVTQSYNLTLQSYDCLILQSFNLTIIQSYNHSILQ